MRLLFFTYVENAVFEHPKLNELASSTDLPACEGVHSGAIWGASTGGGAPSGGFFGRLGGILFSLTMMFNYLYTTKSSRKNVLDWVRV